jgi:DNA topoisomerase IA
MNIEFLPSLQLKTKQLMAAKIFNNKQVSNHFAIIPTQQIPKNLSEEEYEIYDMILKDFLCIFSRCRV